MNSVGCSRGCDYWICEYCFDLLTNQNFKEEVLFPGNLNMFLSNSSAPSAIYYPLINSKGFSNLIRFD